MVLIDKKVDMKFEIKYKIIEKKQKQITPVKCQGTEMFGSI